LHPEKLLKCPQLPFHFAGGGPNPSSLKLSDWGVIPAKNAHLVLKYLIINLINY